MLPAAALLGFLAAASSPMLQAQPLAEEYEPPSEQSLLTETVETQDKGQVTFTWGGSFTNSDGNYSSQHPASIEYGITDRWQLKFELGSSMARNPLSGSLDRTTGDWLVGTKRDFQNLGGSDVHLAAGFNFATRSDKNHEMSSGARTSSPYLVVAKDLPRSSRVFTQVGFDFVRTMKYAEEPTAHVLSVNTGYYFPVGEFLLTSELGLSTDRWNNAGQTREMYFTPGIFRRVSDRWWIGAGIPVGLNGDADKFSVMVALVYEFNVFPVLN